MSFDRFLILSIYVTFSLMKTLEKYLYGNTFMQVFCASSQPSDRYAPITSKGKILYGICMGILTGLFRLFGASAEGVSYAIIISNLLVPLIEKVTLPKPFGKGGEK